MRMERTAQAGELSTREPELTEPPRLRVVLRRRPLFHTDAALAGALLVGIGGSGAGYAVADLFGVAVVAAAGIAADLACHEAPRVWRRVRLPKG